MISMFNRNDLIRAIALVSVVSFPLIAAAHLAPSQPSRSSSDVAPASSAPIKDLTVSRDPCAEQHWPDFSPECLRGSEGAKPRLISTAPAAPQESASHALSANRIAAPEQVQASASPSLKRKQARKARHAAHRHERGNSVTYAASSEPVVITPPSW